ncbi:MAG: DUF3311 domain-containing protein, partial [Alicyclobacillus sp.]|nr:DUF3311 domain-containing protein [Alicyclobacillus sp.]
RKALGFVIALGLPFVAILLVVPFSSRWDFDVLGFPFLYFWIFLWFPLTSLCMHVAWRIADRGEGED